MNTRQIQALDRQRTVVLIPGGIIEEHGPYLPSYTDGYAIEAYTRALAMAIVARPGWTVVVFPQWTWRPSSITRQPWRNGNRTG